MSPRIMFVAPSLEYFAAPIALVYLAKALAERGWKVHVACLARRGGFQQTLESSGVRVHFINWRSTVNPVAFWRLRSLIRSLAPDIVHTWHSANGPGRLAAISARAGRIVASSHDAHWPNAAVERYLARKTERIIVNSEALRNDFVQWGLDAAKVVVISSHIMAPEWKPNAEADPLSRESLLLELGLPTNVELHLMATLDPLLPHHRIKDCIWAAELLKVVRDDVHLLIIGDGPHRWRLERFCRLVGNNDKVHFLGTRNDLGRILPCLVALWSASSHRAQTEALVEAMAAGLPVIASDTPAHRELVSPGETGYLVPLGDSAALARKTQTLLKDRSLARQLGLAGRTKALRDYSAERMIESNVALYEG